jgi:hypothetical protein
MPGIPRNRSPLHHSKIFQLIRSAVARVLFDRITTDALALFIKRRERIHLQACWLMQILSPARSLGGYRKAKRHIPRRRLIGTWRISIQRPTDRKVSDADNEMPVRPIRQDDIYSCARLPVPDSSNTKCRACLCRGESDACTIIRNSTSSEDRRFRFHSDSMSAVFPNVVTPERHNERHNERD